MVEPVVARLNSQGRWEYARGPKPPTRSANVDRRGYRLVPVASDPFAKISPEPGLAPGWMADPQVALAPAPVNQLMALPPRKQVDLAYAEGPLTLLSRQQMLDERQQRREAGVHPERAPHPSLFMPGPRGPAAEAARGMLALPLVAPAVVAESAEGGVNLLRRLVEMPARMSEAERRGEDPYLEAIGPITEGVLTLATGGAGRALGAGTTAGLGVLGGRLSRGFPHHRVPLAERLRADGESPGRIWRSTGLEWNEKLNDWVYEIDPAGMKIDIGDTGSRARFRGRMPQAVDYPELYEAYPQLRDATIDITIDPTIRAPNGSASYQPVKFVDDAGNVTGDGPPIIVIEIRSPNMREAEAILQHEFQHPIQRVEGWPVGGDPNDSQVTAVARERMGPVVLEKLEGRLAEIDAQRRAYQAEAVRGLPPALATSDARYAAGQNFWIENPELLDEQRWLYGAIAATRRGDQIDPPRNERFKAYQAIEGEIQARVSEDRTHATQLARQMLPPSEFEDIEGGLRWVRQPTDQPLRVRDPRLPPRGSTASAPGRAAAADRGGDQGDPTSPDITRSEDPREAGFNYSSGWPEDLPKPAIYDDAISLAERMRERANAASVRSWDMEMARRNGEPVDDMALSVARAARTDASQRQWTLDMAIRDVRLASTPAERASSVARLERVFREMSDGTAASETRPLKSRAPVRRGALAGAPPGVKSPRDEGRRRQAYLNFVLDGIEGRRWYEESGRAVSEAVGDDPGRLRRTAETLAITSQATGAQGNMGFAVQGSNQAAVGMPVRTGRLPMSMSPKAQEALTGSGAASGQKVEPFAEQLMIGAGRGPGRAAGERAVHDRWDARAWGYEERADSGLSPTEHRWMDRQTDRIIAYLNKNNIDGGGWTPGQVQAAAWTGVRKQQKGPDAQAGSFSFADALPRTYAQGSRETVPGSNTGHLVGLESAPMEVRQAYDDEVAKIIYDAKGRDRIALGYGAMVGPSFRGPGIYEGGINPGRQTQVATAGAGGVGGSRALDAASTALMDATEATYGLLTAQKAAAYNRIFGAPRAAANGATIALPGGPMTVEQATEIMRSGRFGGDIAVVPDREGVRLLYFGENAADFQLRARALAGTLKGGKPKWGVVSGNLIENAWETPAGRFGQQYAERIDRPELPRLGPSFDELAPPIAAKIRELDEKFGKERGFAVSQHIQELRAAIAADGRVGVNKLVKRLGIGAAGIVPFTQAAQALGLLDEEGKPVREPGYRTGKSF